jgi:hypothetical protein
MSAGNSPHVPASVSIGERRFLMRSLVLSLLPLGAQEAVEEPLARAGTPAPWSPRIYLMDGGTHPLLQKMLLAEKFPSTPVTIDSRWVYQPYPGADFWGIDLAKMKGILAALASEVEKEQRVPAGKPRPLRILWLGSSFYGAPDAWGKQLDRLTKTALIIAPAGNDP